MQCAHPQRRTQARATSRVGTLSAEIGKAFPNAGASASCTTAASEPAGVGLAQLGGDAGEAMFSGQPASTTADGFVSADRDGASEAASRMGNFPRAQASQTSLASSATTRIGPDNAMADTPPTPYARS